MSYKKITIDQIFLPPPTNKNRRLLGYITHEYGTSERNTCSEIISTVNSGCAHLPLGVYYCWHFAVHNMAVRYKELLLQPPFPKRFDMQHIKFKLEG